MSTSNNRWLQAAETLVISLLGAFLFQMLRVPLPFMLGPIASVMIYRLLTKRTLYWPRFLRQGSLILLGYMLGSAFTRDAGLQILRGLPSIIAATIITIAFSLTMGFLVTRFADIDLYSGVFGSVPGGLSNMVAMAEEVEGVDPTIVTFMQTFRMIAVVFCVPFLTVHGIADQIDHVAIPDGDQLVILHTVGHPWLNVVLYAVVAVAGGLLGAKIKMPVAYLTGPLVTTAALVLIHPPAPQLPSTIITIAQLCIGAHFGLQMKPGNLPNLRRLSLYTILSSVALVLFTLLVGYVISRFNPITLTTGFLSTAPGGMAEMGVTAKLVHADLSIVSGYQLFRIFFVMFAVPPLLKWWIRRKNRTVMQ